MSPEIEDFDAVTRRYWPRIFRFALASLRDEDAAQAVAQDCLLKAYRGRQRFRGEATIQTWLMRIALNLVRDNARSRKRQFWKLVAAYPVDGETVREWIPDSGLDPEQRILVKEQVDAVWRAMGRLPETQRTVFLLRYVDELEVPEIAALTGLREAVLRGHLYRALTSIRASVGRLR
jgi:RNA polymerase sigma-70 factor (ECF subfamily)